MYCNDPASARQAMCFHLDSEISPKLAFVQFPHNFHNISDNDIYDSQLRTFFTVRKKFSVFYYIFQSCQRHKRVLVNHSFQLRFNSSINQLIPLFNGMIQNQWYGMDGITGPINCGTWFYITREALCETSGSIQEGMHFFFGIISVTYVWDEV